MAQHPRKEPEIGVRLRRSRRARRATLRVRPGRPPEVVLPLRMPASAADRLIAENRSWLARKLDWARSVEAEANRLGLSRPGIVWISANPRPAPILGPAGSQAEDGGESALERWYRAQARSLLLADTERIWQELHRDGLVQRRHRRISIRDQSSRWGSCSGKGNLSYSWRLVMMPAAVREYVVLHELCHLRRLDHSPQFWALVEKALPEWKAAAAWLRSYGPLLALHRPRMGVGMPAALPAPLPEPTDG